MSVDMDVVGVMGPYLPVVHLGVSLDCEAHKRTTGKYATITTTTYISTDTIEPLL